MLPTCRKCGQITNIYDDSNTRMCQNNGPNHGRCYAYCTGCREFLAWVDGQPNRKNGHRLQAQYPQPQPPQQQPQSQHCNGDTSLILHKLTRLEEQLSLLMEKVTQIEHNIAPKGGLFSGSASSSFFKSSTSNIDPIFTKTNQEQPEVEVFTSTPATTKLPSSSPFM